MESLLGREFGSVLPEEGGHRDGAFEFYNQAHKDRLLAHDVQVYAPDCGHVAHYRRQFLVQGF